MAALFSTLIAAGRLDLFSQGWRGPLAVLALGAGSLWLTYGVCLLARRSCPDILAIAIEVVVRNGNLALLLQASLFTQPVSTASQAIAAADPSDAVGAANAAGALYAILMYVCISLGIGCLEVTVHRHSSGVIYGRAARMRTAA
jgi:hypothetical protein